MSRYGIVATVTEPATTRIAEPPDPSWNATTRELPEATLAALFEAQVTRTPEAVAVRWNGRDTSYTELNQAANQLARGLVARGIGPEQIVAAALPRGLDAVLALLAVSKAGGAFLPIDLRHPSDRTTRMLADAGPRLLLTQSAVIGRLSPVELSSLEVTVAELRAESAGLTPTDLTDHDRIAPLRPGHPAYLIFTSGSTGKPKGVLVTHQGIASLAATQGELFQVGVGSRVLQFASLSFDAAVSELCMALLRGATLVVVPQERLAPGAALAEVVRAEGISHLTLPPAVLPLHEEADRLPPGLALIVAGEACPLETARRWAAGRLMLNAYGPTESTVCASMGRLTSNSGRPSIGRPIANTRIHVLDPELRQVAVGSSGEMFVSGRGLARGYLRSPGQTAARFLPDPFASDGERMYRTGDLGCWRPDGMLDFLGRVDEQIKIRGHRVEPAEIERVLRQDPTIAQARVVLCQDGGHPRLIGYLVPVPYARIGIAAVRRLIAAQLPSYMAPAGYVVLDELPLNTSGKLDRAALPPPTPPREPTGVPSTPQEEMLCRLFAETLAVPRVGTLDNFFELGGDSLLAARLAGRVRATFAVALAVPAIVEAGTPAALARQLGAGDRQAALKVLLPLRISGSRPPLFCIHPASGLGWSYAGLLAHVDSLHPVYGIQARGLLDCERPASSLDELVEDYLRTIRTVQPIGPYHLLGWSFGGLVAHALTARLEQAGERVALLALLDAYPVVPPELRHQGIEELVLADLLHFINLPIGQLPDGVLDRARVLEVARREGSALASLDAAAIERVVDVFAANRQILCDYQPRDIDSDVLFFTALRSRREGLTASLWSGHSRGGITEYQLDCDHRDMTGPAALARIGPVVAARLARSAETAGMRADPGSKPVRTPISTLSEGGRG